MKVLFFISLACVLSLSAQVLISPHDAMNSAYPSSTNIEKKNMILSKKNASIISKQSKTKLKSKIFRIFKAYKNEEIIGYGILISKKVRSKNAVILYIISSDAVLKSIEIIAFNEPLEYIPSKTWKSQFQNIQTSQMLRTSKEIPTITGATLSARSITDGSRLAFAFYNQMLKSK
ncbi:MAG: FMN-binding protein [Sulfurimonas sp.]|nr:FMN-binding protein [Sulfurimonas sp.]MDQ7062249.1 FMN-binding protein [Sulfurimonas sp.]